MTNGVNYTSNLSISFVFPMYNECDIIENSVREIQKMALELACDYEIIISDDASTDGSEKIIDRMAAENSYIKAMHLSKNTKLGGALKAGLMAATKDIIVYTDSDLPVSFLDMKESLLLIKDAEIVTATSLVKKGESIRRITISIVYNMLVNLFFKLGMKDINSGYKIFKTRIFKDMDLYSESPFISVEIFLKAKEKGYKIKQFPTIYRQRSAGKSSVVRIPVIWQTFFDMTKYWTKD